MRLKPEYDILLWFDKEFVMYTNFNVNKMYFSWYIRIPKYCWLPVTHVFILSPNTSVERHQLLGNSVVNKVLWQWINMQQYRNC
jgi:hypothetical protein